ncbi:IS200/IS605 family element transposase accessory protein TnpB [Clostridium botulinum]|uniref:IS200/IS605 family element transposase accessory protein TnpB n=1 Tax=Clostridium botulinum TaxID=1491 RepID=A0AA44BQW8_CLOBO|nr:IS200/IS605 family element transposase accessory protein TnpB [Clostridium botulinum]NFI22838.1 IS200/IS605 family element transposase accessory protein TnpB [Clostridium botulinum]NFQ79751.1 IS200/IS605 family element transposase accessory protein TnpB [Clostridium botulinum]
MRTLTIRLYPTKEQEILFKKHIGTARYIYNWGLALNNGLYKVEKKKYSTTELGKMLTQYKKECIWLNEVSNATLKDSLRSLDKAYSNFYKKYSKLPKFKSKKHCKLSFYSRYEKIYFKDTVVNLEKIGKVKYKSSYDMDLTEISKFSNPHISYNGRCWILTVGIENTIEEVNLTNEVIGIDLGIKHLAICSDGVEFKNINKTKVIKNSEKRLHKLQRKISKKYEMNKKGKRYVKTSNIIKLEKRIKKLHLKLKNIRKDYILKSTTSIVKNKPCRVVMEDLNISGMMKNKHLSKAIQQQNLYEFIRQMKYKCEWLGVEFIQVSRFYPSSKTCSCCGRIKKDLKLSDRTYICSECGLVIDRDLNASINLANCR